MCTHNKAGCTSHNMTRMQHKQSAVVNPAASPDQEATLAGFMPSRSPALRRIAPACSLHDKINHSSSSCSLGKPTKTVLISKQANNNNNLQRTIPCSH